MRKPHSVSSPMMAILAGVFLAAGTTHAVSVVELNILGRRHGTVDALASSLTVPAGFTGQFDLAFQIVSTRTAPEAIDGVAFSLGASDPTRFIYVDFGGSHGGIVDCKGPFDAGSYSGGLLPVAGTDLTHVLNLAYFDSAASFQPSAFPATGSMQLILQAVNGLAAGSYVFSAITNPPYVTDVSYQDSANKIFAGDFGRIGDFTLIVMEVPEPGWLGLLASGGLIVLHRTAGRPNRGDG